MPEQRNENDVLEDVGVVACVKGVSIAEHPTMMTQHARRCGKIARMASDHPGRESLGTIGTAALLWALVAMLVVSLLLHERRTELARAEATAQALTMA